MRKQILAGFIGVGLVSTLAIGYTAYSTFDKEVTLTVDGKPRTVHTFGNTVGELVADEKLQLDSRDSLVPGPDKQLQDGTEISVKYARPVTLTVDGETSEHWVTALDVNEALEQLEVRDDGARISTSRSQRIGRGGAELEVRTQKDLTVVHDGRKTSMDAAVLDVDEALEAADIEVDADDRIAPGPAALIEDGATITVWRVETKTKDRKVEVPYETIRKADSDLYEDETEVLQSGEAGLQAQVVETVYVDGEKRDTEVLERSTVRKPVKRIVAYGTAERPTHGPDIGGSVDDLNWEALAECESSGDPRAVNPAGYYGLYQFALSTWESVGGSGNPIDASPDEQTYRAKLLYVEAGAGQWACGSHLYD